MVYKQSRTESNRIWSYEVFTHQQREVGDEGEQPSNKKKKQIHQINVLCVALTGLVDVLGQAGLLMLSLSSP